MQEHTLLFHVGTLKTGTSAIQFFLRDNSEFIQQNGWFFPSDENHTKTSLGKNGKNLLKCILKMRDVDWKNEDWEIAWMNLKNCLEKYNVIISNEEYSCQKNLVYFLEEAVKQHSNIKVLIYLRRQDLYMESNWNQTIKSAYLVEDCLLEDAIKYSAYGRKADHYLYCDYLEMLREIESAVGKENIILRIYEKEQLAHGDSALDFLSAIGIHHDSKLLIQKNDANPRLDGQYMEMKRIFNEVYKANFEEYRIYRIRLREMEKFVAINEPERCGCMDGTRRVGYLSAEQRKDILERFREDNATIAREYLHREDGILFYDDDVDIPQYVPNETEFERGMMRVFSQFALQADIQAEAVSEIMTKQSQVFALMGKKKCVACFGAGRHCSKVIEKILTPMDCIIDNSPTKWGNVIEGATVLSPASIDDWRDYYILITPVDADAAATIGEGLAKRGLRRYVDYVWAKEIGL